MSVIGKWGGGGGGAATGGGGAATGGGNLLTFKMDYAGFYADSLTAGASAGLTTSTAAPTGFKRYLVGFSFKCNTVDALYSVDAFTATDSNGKTHRSNVRHFVRGVHGDRISLVDFFGAGMDVTGSLYGVSLINESAVTISTPIVWFHFLEVPI